MKLLLCHNYYKKTSGEDLVIREDLRILREHSVEVIEYSRSNAETDEFSLGRKLAFFPNTLYSTRTTREVRELIDDVSPDVAVVQNVFPLISPSVYHTLHAVGVPVVQLVYNYRLICPNAILFTEGKICERCIGGNYLHAVIHKCYKESWFLSTAYAGALGLHRVLGPLSKLISAYVTPDVFLKRKLVEGGFPAERIFPVLNPFDVGRYTTHFGHDGYFVYFGRIVQEKGIFTALNAVGHLADTKLVVVGEGEAEDEARKSANEKGLRNVEFKGPQYGEDLIAILRGAIAVLVPTLWYDNSPLVIHQAFALGKPVIASDIDGIPEIVEHRKTGLLFQPGDATGLAASMKELATDESLRLTLAQNARRKAETQFTAQQRFEELMKVFAFAQKERVCA